MNCVHILNVALCIGRRGASSRMTQHDHFLHVLNALFCMGRGGIFFQSCSPCQLCSFVQPTGLQGQEVSIKLNSTTFFIPQHIVWKGRAGGSIFKITQHAIQPIVLKGRGGGLKLKLHRQETPNSVGG